MNYVVLTLDIEDGSGNLPGRTCSASFVPSAVLTDSGVTIIDQAPVTVVFNGIAAPTVRLLATDNSGPQPTGWTWGVTFTGPGMPGPSSFFLPFTGGADQNLSALVAVQSGTAFQGYMPLPSGTATSGYVPIASGSGEASTWGPVSGTGTVTSASVATANGFAGTVANPSTTPAITIETTVAGLLKGNGTAVSAATAGTDYLAPSGSGSALTGITASQVGADVSGAASSALSSAESFATAAVGTETTRAEAAEAGALQKASNLSDLANAGTARTNLGLGSAATHASTDFDAAGAATTAVATETSRAEAAEALALPKAGGTMTGALVPAVVALSQSGGSVAVNAALGNVFTLLLTASGWTIANPSNPADGQVIRIRLIQDTSGSRTLASWGSAFDWGGGSAPTLSTAANKTDIVAFEFMATTVNGSPLNRWLSLGASFPQGY